MISCSSLSTHSVAGRGVVKVVLRSELTETVSVGQRVCTDGRDCIVSGIDYVAGPRVGLFVRELSEQLGRLT